jgi:putative endonuclease
MANRFSKCEGREAPQNHSTRQANIFLLRSMPEKHETGRRGEDAAFHFLVGEGYEILVRNFRVKGGELDIVARSKTGDIVVIEVKTRSSNAFGFPETFVDIAKQKRIIQAALSWQEANAPMAGIRFDVISVERDGKTTRIRHFEDAFRP